MASEEEEKDLENDLKENLNKSFRQMEYQKQVLRSVQEVDHDNEE